MDYVDRMAGRSASFDPNTLLKFTPLCARTRAPRIADPHTCQWGLRHEVSRRALTPGCAARRSRPVQQHLAQVYFTLACALGLAALGTVFNWVTGVGAMLGMLGFVGCAAWLASLQASPSNLNKRCAHTARAPGKAELVWAPDRAAGRRGAPGAAAAASGPHSVARQCAARAAWPAPHVKRTHLGRCATLCVSGQLGTAPEAQTCSAARPRLTLRPLCVQVPAAGRRGVQPGRHAGPAGRGRAGRQPGAAAHGAAGHRRRVRLLQRGGDAVAAALVAVPGRDAVLGARPGLSAEAQCAASAASECLRLRCAWAGVAHLS